MTAATGSKTGSNRHTNTRPRQCQQSDTKHQQTKTVGTLDIAGIGQTRISRGCFNAIIRIQIRRMLLLSGAGWCVVIVARIITVRCVAVRCVAVGYIATVETIIVCVTSVAVACIDCTWHYAWVVAVVGGGVHHFSTDESVCERERERECVCVCVCVCVRWWGAQSVYRD